MKLFMKIKNNKEGLKRIRL
jgi:hypothetical protein